MPISITITGEDENDWRRQLMRIATPYLEGFIEAGGFTDPEPEATEPPSAAELAAHAAAAIAPTPPPDAVDTPKRIGRPRGSTNKPKTNGNGAEPPPQTETEAQAPPANGAIPYILPLTEQIQLITDAAHDQPDRFKPLLVPLRDKLGVQYVSKATEKDRPVLQAFITEHGLAV
jgi:hypothetical protein